MDLLSSLFARFPQWAGSMPMWGIFAMVLIALIKAWPRLKEIGVNEREGIRDPYLKRIRELAEDVKQCRAECDQQEFRLRKEIETNRTSAETRERELKNEVDELKKKLNNEAWQRVQSEISLVNTLIQVVDAPELRIILDALQRRSAILPMNISAIGGPVGDADSEGNN